MPTRVLLAERISSDKRESTSIERQHEQLTERATALGVDVVGVAVDRSVSGDVDLTDRPALAEWLSHEGRARWDELWVTTADRLSRNDLHYLAFIFSIIEWGKTLVVLDDPTLDLTTVEGRLIAHAKGIGPAKELERIKARVKDSHAYRRYTPAWQAGIPPLGYTTVDEVREGNVRRVLALDAYGVTLLHEIRRWIVDDGLTVQAAVRRLNERGEPNRKDRWRIEHNREPLGTAWTVAGLIGTLTSRGCLGVKLQGKRPLTNRDGSEVVICEPVFTPDEWETLQQAIAVRRSGPQQRVNGASPLLGVVFCAHCKRRANRTAVVRETANGPVEHAYYRCKGEDGIRCSGVSIRAADAETLVEEQFLSERGDNRVIRKQYVPGNDTSDELTDVRRRIARLREDREAGLFDDDQDYYRDKMTEYTDRRRELESQTVQEPRWVDVPQLHTYAEVWESSSTDERRKLLIDAGVRLEIIGRNVRSIIVPKRGTAMGTESIAATESVIGKTPTA